MVWRCVSRVLKKSSGIECPARTIHEEDLQAAVVTAVNDAWTNRETVIPALRANIESVLNSSIDDRIKAVDTAIKEKQTELLSAGKDEKKIATISKDILALREEKQDILNEAARNKGIMERMEDLTAFLGEQTGAVTEYSETLVRWLIEKITVYDEKLVVEFKSGLTVEVEI